MVKHLPCKGQQRTRREEAVIVGERTQGTELQHEEAEGGKQRPEQTPTLAQHRLYHLQTSEKKTPRDLPPPSFLSHSLTLFLSCSLTFSRIFCFLSSSLPLFLFRALSLCFFSLFLLQLFQVPSLSLPLPFAFCSSPSHSLSFLSHSLSLSCSLSHSIPLFRFSPPVSFISLKSLSYLFAHNSHLPLKLISSHFLTLSSILRFPLCLLFRKPPSFFTSSLVLPSISLGPPILQTSSLGPTLSFLFLFSSLSASLLFFLSLPDPPPSFLLSRSLSLSHSLGQTPPLHPLYSQF